MTNGENDILLSSYSGNEFHESKVRLWEGQQSKELN